MSVLRMPMSFVIVLATMAFFVSPAAAGAPLCPPTLKFYGKNPDPGGFTKWSPGMVCCVDAIDVEPNDRNLKNGLYYECYLPPKPSPPPDATTHGSCQTGEPEQGTVCAKTTNTQQSAPGSPR